MKSEHHPGDLPTAESAHSRVETESIAEARQALELLASFIRSAELIP